MLSAVGQRRRRQAKIKTNKNYEAEYDYDDYKLGTSKEDPSMASQRYCRCPSQQPPTRRSSPGTNRYDYNGPRRGTEYFSYRGGDRRGNGYIPRRRGSSRWFDERDDYADDILVYRFYNGRNRPSVEEMSPRRTGYQVQQRSVHGEYQQGISVGGRVGDSASQYQGGTPVASNTSTLESQGWIPNLNTTRRNENTESGDPGISSEHDTESVYESGVNSGSSKRKTENILFLTTKPTPSTSPNDDIGDCCYQTGYEERRRVGDTGRGTGYRLHRSTTTTTKKPVNFFGITWSRLSDYSDVTDEIDSDSRSVNFDKEKDRNETVR